MTPAANSGEALTMPLAGRFGWWRGKLLNHLFRNLPLPAASPDGEELASVLNEVSLALNTRPPSPPETMGEADKKLLADLRARAKDVAESVTMAQHEQSHFHSGTLEPEVIPVRPEETLWGKIVDLIDRLTAELATAKVKITELYADQRDDSVLIEGLKREVRTAEAAVVSLRNERDGALDTFAFDKWPHLRVIETTDIPSWLKAESPTANVVVLLSGPFTSAMDCPLHDIGRAIKAIRALKRPSPQKAG